MGSMKAVWQRSPWLAQPQAGSKDSRNPASSHSQEWQALLFSVTQKTLAFQQQKTEKQAFKILLKIPHIFFTQRWFSLQEFSKGNKLLHMEN